MRIKGLIISALLAALTAGAAATATAGDLTNWIGFSLGKTDYNNNNLGGITPGSVDSSGNNWKIYLGFPITSNLGLEVGHMVLGNQSIANGADHANAEARIYNVDLLGKVDVRDDLFIFGKAGFYWWGMHSDKTVSGTSSTADDDGFKLKYGLGLQYSATPEIGLRLEWERLDKLGFKGTTGSAGADLLTFGAQFNFKFF
jgi:opacity protein-like surface antigen